MLVDILDDNDVLNMWDEFESFVSSQQLRYKLHLYLQAAASNATGNISERMVAGLEGAKTGALASILLDAGSASSMLGTF